MRYLTIKEKKALVLAGKNVPLCVGESKSKNSSISKLLRRAIGGSWKDKIISI